MSRRVYRDVSELRFLVWDAPGEFRRRSNEPNAFIWVKHYYATFLFGCFTYHNRKSVIFAHALDKHIFLLCIHVVCTRLSGKTIFWFKTKDFIYWACRMDLPQTLHFRVPMYYASVYESVFALESEVVYTRCSSTMWVDVGLMDWVP